MSTKARPRDHGDSNAKPECDGRWRTRLRRRLLAWFAAHERPLPWRKTRDPYAVWVSEIMLQQTQVATVKDYYQRFLARFPNVESLAAAAEAEVLRLWEGLGYYRRARQLHAAAKTIATEHAGQLPRTVEGLKSLPGIGRYTAGAIASIAYDLPAPILEANSIRLLCRLLAVEDDPARAAAQRRLWAAAELLAPARGAGRFNQALMELGSLVCTPREPACESCPLAPLCEARLRGMERTLPAAGRKMQFEDRTEAAIVIWRAGKYLLRQCGPGERWAGLWDFPRFVLEAGGPPPSRKHKLSRHSRGGGNPVSALADPVGHTPPAAKAAADRRWLAQEVRQATGLAIELGRPRATIKHGVTRFRITLDCYEARAVAGRKRGGEDLRWVSPANIEQYPLSVTGRKLARLVAPP